MKRETKFGLGLAIFIAAGLALWPPQGAPEALSPLAGYFGSTTLVVSIMAGRTIDFLEKSLPPGAAIVRVMPNTPALVGEAATAAFAGPSISADDKAGLSVMMEAFSKATVWVDREELIDVVVGLSGMLLSFCVPLHIHKSAYCARRG